MVGCISSAYGRSGLSSLVWGVILHTVCGLFLAMPGFAAESKDGAAWEHPAMVAWQNRPIPEITAAADKGDGLAQYYLAWINWFGERGQSDREMAVRWFQAAATNDVHEAQFKLGVLAEHGIGRAPDRDEALAWYKKSAATGNTVAKYKFGLLGGYSSITAQRFKDEAIGENYPQALFKFVRSVDRAGMVINWDRVFPLYQTTAEYGIAEAQFRLVTAYLAGKGVKQNHATAYKWLWLAAQHGNPDAERYLQNQDRLFTAAECEAGKRAAGSYVEKRLKPEWAHWERLLFNSVAQADDDGGPLIEKASAGDADAQYALGLLYCHESRQVIADETPLQVLGKPLSPAAIRQLPRKQAAFKWLQLAALQHHQDAAFLLGIRLLYGTGCLVDQNEGLRFMRRAALAGHQEARYQLALFHAQNGRLSRLYEAVHWGRLAAADHHPLAEQWLQGFLAANFVGGITATRNAGVADRVANAEKNTSRLAIIVSDPDLSSAADILTAYLSESPQIMVLERAEIDRIVREHALSLQQLQDRLKLSKLLAADGLLFLESTSKDGQPWLSLQLVAVQPGVVVNEQLFPWPPKDISLWAQFAAVRQIPLLAKLAVPRQQAIPISLLNFSSPILTEHAVSTDREVTDLLARRLVYQPDLFVLERRRLEKLADEKALDTSARAFWNGSWILEGEINPEGMRKDEMSLRARLKSPAGDQQELLVNGKTGRLPQMIDALAAKIATAVHSGSPLRSWNPLEEAAQYYDEARWQMESKLYAETQASAESAWALGLRTRELAALRVRMYSSRLPFHYARYSMDEAVTPPAKAPSEATVQMALRGLDRYHEETLLYKEGVSQECIDSGVDLLTRSLELLAELYSTRDQLHQRADSLVVLREKVRELRDFLAAKPGIDKPREGLCFPRTMLMYAALSEETLAQGIRYYDTVVRRGGYLDLLAVSEFNRGHFFQLASWDGHDRQEVRLAWENQLQRWAQDPVFKVQASAALISLNEAGSSYQKKDAWNSLATCLLDHRQELVAGKVSTNVWQMAKNAPDSGWVYRSLVPKQDSFLYPLHLKLEPLFKEVKEAELARNPPRNKLKPKTYDEVYAAFQKAIAEKQQFTDGTWRNPYSNFAMDLQGAERLIPLLLKYQELFPRGDFYYHATFGQVVNTYTKNHIEVPASLDPLGRYKPRKRPDVVIQTFKPAEVPESPRIFPAQTFKAPRFNENTNAVDLKLPASVTYELPVPANSVDAQPTVIRDWVFSQQRLWLSVERQFYRIETRNNSYGSVSCLSRALLEIDPQTGETLHVHAVSIQEHSYPTAYFNPMADSQWNAGKTFAVTDSDMFFLSGDTLLAKSRAGRIWRRFSVDLPQKAALVSVGSRVFVIAPEVILELLPRQETARVLASNRRRPVVSPLDQEPDLSGTVLFPGPDNSLRAIAGKDIYLMSSKGTDWQPVGKVPPAVVYSRRYKESGGTLLYEMDDVRFDQGIVLQALPADGTEFLRLVESNPLGNARWHLPKNLKLRDLGWTFLRSWCWDHSVLWLAVSGSNPKPDTDRFALVWFDPKNNLPVIIHLDFQGDDQQFTKTNVSDRSKMEVIAHDGNITLLMPWMNRLWCVSRAQLDKVLRSAEKTDGVQQKERLTYLLKRKAYWEKLFDRNGNGILEPDEDEAMRKNERVRNDLLEIERLNGIKN